MTVDIQSVFNLVSVALLSLALFNIRQIFSRIEKLEDGDTKKATDLARLNAQHSALFSRLDRIENKLDRLLNRDTD